MPAVASKKEKAAQVAGVTATLTGKIGDLTDQLFAVREKKRALEEQMKAVEGEYAGIEEALMAKLEEQGIDAAKGSKATCSITKNTSGNITDWDAFCSYVKKNNYFHLFQRRLSDASYRELLAAGKKVSGVEPFTRKRLNLRTL